MLVSRDGLSTTALLNAGDDADEESSRIAARAVKGACSVLEPLDVADLVIEAIGVEVLELAISEANPWTRTTQLTFHPKVAAKRCS